MRTREQNKDYLNKYRFGKKVQNLRAKRIRCVMCENLAETLHHKDEDHNNNRSNNLIPVCRTCHLRMVHKEELKYPTHQRRAYNRTETPQKQVLQKPKSIVRPINSLGTVTLCHKSLKHMHLHCDVKHKTITMLEGLGYEQVA